MRYLLLIRRYLVGVTSLQWFIVLTLITVALAIGLPPDPHSLAQLHTTQTAYRLAVLALLVPYIVIWYFGFFAFGRLRNYLAHVRKSKEGHAFRLITLGMGWLAFGLVVPTAVSLILTAVAVHHPGSRAAATVIANYLSLAVPVIVFTFVGKGVHELAITSKVRPSYLGIRLFVAGFTVLGVIYSYLVLHNLYNSDAPYHLGLWPLILTYISPYLYAWFIGLFCAYELRLYARKVPGTLYRRSLDRFSYGLVVVISGSVAIQFIGSAISNNNHLHLASVLLIDYLLLVVVAIGLALLAYGTKGLQKIEEV